MRFRLVPKVIPDPVHLGLPLRGYLAQGVPEPVLADKEGPFGQVPPTPSLATSESLRIELLSFLC